MCESLFKSIDINKDGSLERSEITGFITQISKELGLEVNPDDQELKGVYEELDVDGNGDVDLDELQVFLKRIFIL